MAGAFLTDVHVSSFVHFLLSHSVQHGSTTLSLNTVKLQLLEIFGKSTNGCVAQSCSNNTIMHINGPESPGKGHGKALRQLIDFLF